MIRTAEAKVKFIRQRSQYTCMAASVTSALAACGKNLSEDDVNAVMGATPLQGASWEQALATVQYFGCRGALVVPATLKMLKSWTDQGIPVLIAWNPENRPWSHASVVFDVKEDGTVYVMDPNIPDPEETVRVVPKDEFHHKWMEKVSDSLIVRRPAMAVMQEITPDGRQVLASNQSQMRIHGSKGKTGTQHHPHTYGYGMVPKTGTVTRIRVLGSVPGSPESAYGVTIDHVEYLVEGPFPRGLGHGSHVDFVAGRAPDPVYRLSHAYDIVISSGQENAKVAKRPQPVVNKKKPDNKIRVEAPTQRDPNARALAQRGNSGGGSHHNREDDFERGRNRKPKHKVDWQGREASGWDDDDDSYDLDRDARRMGITPEQLRRQLEEAKQHPHTPPVQPRDPEYRDYGPEAEKAMHQLLAKFPKDRLVQKLTQKVKAHHKLTDNDVGIIRAYLRLVGLRQYEQTFKRAVERVATRYEEKSHG